LPVTLPEIKRIEVLKGPASAVYGFNAFDGVINIITKSPEEITGTTLQFGAGEFGTITASAIEAGTYGKFGYRLSAGRDQGNQWRDRNALAFRAHKFNIDTHYALPNDGNLLVSGGFVDLNRLERKSELTVSSNRPSQGYANVGYERPNFFLRAWWSQFDDTNKVAPNPILAGIFQALPRDLSPVFTTNSNTYNVETQYSLDLGSFNRLMYGVNYRLNKVSSNFIDGASEERLGFYLQDEWQITRALMLTGGFRYDLDTFIHPTISPRVAVLYNLSPGHVLRAALSVAYRPPTILEKHINARTVITLPSPIPSPPPIVTQGASDLKPEQIISYEVGYQGWYFRHRLRIRTDLFYNQLSDLVTDRLISPGIASFTNDPGKAEIYGGEASAAFLATSWLTGFMNFSYEEISQTFTDTTRRGAPRFKWNIGVRGEWENGLSGEAALYHVGAATYPLANSFTAFSPFFPPGVTVPSTWVGSYNLLNLRAGYRFWHEKAEVAVSVFNALNDRHKEHPLGDTIGSRVMGWLTMRF
jgi:iron complex outermembrane receptor protein